MQQALRFNVSLTIQIDETNQISNFLKLVITEAMRGETILPIVKTIQGNPALPKVESNPQIFVSSREAAKLLAISERTLWGFAKSGRILRPIRIGTSVRWNANELRCWADAGCPSNEEWLKMKEIKK
jgi:predicted DNA-binding transcriptional regulator AlpA